MRFSKRDTHDPSLSDLKTVSIDASLVQTDGARISAGIFGSYTDVNNQDFSRNFGATINGRTTLFNAVQFGVNITANRSIYLKTETAPNNKQKSNRAVSGQVDITRPTSFGFVKLGVSGGKSNAENSIYDYEFEKAQLNLQAKVWRFTLGGSLSHQATRYENADTFVSAKRQKSRTSEAMLTVQLETLDSPYIGTIAPYFNFKTFETKSNIPNFEKNGGELTMGITSTF